MSTVIFIPGIKGTQLLKGSRKVWYPTTLDDFYELNISNELNTGSIIGKLTFPNLNKEIDIYAGFFERFGNVIPFPYDWRQSILDIVQLLSKTVSQMEGPITIIAHSMGGLIAKAFLLLNKNSKNKVEKLITIGTPWLGSPDAYKAIMIGDPLIFEDNKFLGIFNLSRDKEIAKLSVDFPSTFQLLPSEQYYQQDGGQYLIKKDKKPATWSDVLARININGNYIQHGKPIHDLMLQPISIPHFALIGHGYATIRTMSERSTGRISVKKNSKFWNGDKVVPLISAIPPNQSENFYIEGEHAELCSMSSTQDWIEWVLGGAQGNPPIGICTNPPNQDEYIRTMEARIMCPVGYTIKDNSGNSVGGNLDPENIDLEKLKGDPGFYTHTIGEEKYLFFRNNEEHKIEIDPYDVGIVNVSVVQVTKNREEKVITYKSTPIDKGSILTLDLTNEPDEEPVLKLYDNNRKMQEIEEVNIIDTKKEYTPVTYNVELLPVEGHSLIVNGITVFPGEVFLNILGDKNELLEVFWAIDNKKPVEYQKQDVIKATDGQHEVVIFGRDAFGYSLEVKTITFIIDTKPVETYPVFEYDPEGGLGITFRSKNEKVGIKETYYRVHNEKFDSDWKKINFEGKEYFPFNKLFPDKNMPIYVEYYSTDVLNRREINPKTVQLFYGDLKVFVWSVKASAFTAQTIWSHITKNYFDYLEVGVLTNKYRPIDPSAIIHDNTKAIVFKAENVEIRVKFSQQYKLYWNGPPTEIVKLREPYNFSFQLLNDEKEPITGTDPTVVIYHYVSKRKLGSGEPIKVEEENGIFYGSFTVKTDYGLGKIKLKVTDDKHKSPALRETILIVEDE